MPQLIRSESSACVAALSYLTAAVCPLATLYWAAMQCCSRKSHLLPLQPGGSTCCHVHVDTVHTYFHLGRLACQQLSAQPWSTSTSTSTFSLLRHSSRPLQSAISHVYMYLACCPGRWSFLIVLIAAAHRPTITAPLEHHNKLDTW